ncbi:hypothetical protein F2P81_025919 [Scophthalmus maximus]|uniref:Uncharacterized protein n=1 Tax=Scophthalmus maximus TaxID=52904 RepID=A0A6A4RNS5_SCOMX|nr:hypothetical protein F2P81_025919 [Scophthalmus maximus]
MWSWHPSPEPILRVSAGDGEGGRDYLKRAEGAGGGIRSCFIFSFRRRCLPPPRLQRATQARAVRNKPSRAGAHDEQHGDTITIFQFSQLDLQGGG